MCGENKPNEDGLEEFDQFVSDEKKRILEEQEEEARLAMQGEDCPLCGAFYYEECRCIFGDEDDAYPEGRYANECPEEIEWDDWQCPICGDSKDVCREEH